MPSTSAQWESCWASTNSPETTSQWWRDPPWPPPPVVTPSWVETPFWSWWTLWRHSSLRPRERRKSLFWCPWRTPSLSLAEALWSLVVLRWVRRSVIVFCYCTVLMCLFIHVITGKIKTGEDLEVVGLVATQKTICTGNHVHFSCICFWMRRYECMYILYVCVYYMCYMSNLRRNLRAWH